MSTSIIPQSTHERKPPRRNITWNDHREIQVRGFAKMSLQGWLIFTDRAVATLEAAHERYQKDSEQFRLTGHEEYARHWLLACFADGEKSLMEIIGFYKERRPLFAAEPDPSKIIRCSRCGAPLSNQISKAFGYGPICRTAPAKEAA